MYQLQRLRNGLAKVAAGLTPFGESVWPGVRNDLFVAHESIYLYFASLAQGKRVLDAGCGCGYGSRILADAGAMSVVAIDIDARSIRYGRRHFAHRAVEFAVADCQALNVASSSFDLVVSSNVLEHLESPEAFLRSVGTALSPGGKVALAVPPITFAEALAQHHAIHYHRSNLTVDQWLALFDHCGWRADVIAHRYPPDPQLPNFRSLSPSRLRPEDFAFLPASRDIMYSDPPITAVFALTRGAA